MRVRVPEALARATFPAPLLELLGTLGAAGHRSWLVGGAVRDLLLARPRATADFDVATPATPPEVKALFRKVIPTGEAHGTVTVLLGGQAFEVTTFRGEGAYADGRRPESVTFHADLEEDLARRDFTMNALAYDPLGGEFRDPFGGQADLAARRVRAVGEPALRFGEDGLRALRAVRFAAQLGYRLEAATRRAIPGALDVVRKVSRERIADELVKLVVAPEAARGLALARATGLLRVILPALAARGDAELRHAERTVACVPAVAELRLAALLHALDAGAVQRLLLELRLSRRTAVEAAALVAAHACRLDAGAAPLPATPEALRRWLSAAGPARAAALLALAEGDARATRPRERAARGVEVQNLKALAAEVLREAPPLSADALALDGAAVMRLLGTGPGPHVGEALRVLLDRVLADPRENDPERLAEAIRLWWAGRSPSL
jgi:tRNA nucleotidyltransferase (CCA-adding enzyme)